MQRREQYFAVIRPDDERNGFEQYSHKSRLRRLRQARQTGWESDPKPRLMGFPHPPAHQTIHFAMATAYYVSSAAIRIGRCELLTQFALVSKKFEKMIEERKI